jgi:hypothetical protein
VLGSCTGHLGKFDCSSGGLGQHVGARISGTARGKGVTSKSPKSPRCPTVIGQLVATAYGIPVRDDE